MGLQSSGTVRAVHPKRAGGEYDLLCGRRRNEGNETGRRLGDYHSRRLHLCRCRIDNR